MSLIKLIQNIFKKDFTLLNKKGFINFFLKFLLHLLFNRQLRNIYKKDITKFILPQKINLTKKLNLENSFLIASTNGLYLKNNNQLISLIENCGGFFGLSHYKNNYYAACFGNGHTRGCLISFKISNKMIFDFKIVFKKRFQYFHGLTVHKNYLYLVDSSWLLNHIYIHKFEIKQDEIKKIHSKEINFEDIGQKSFLNYCHLNTIKFFDNKVFLLFHNMTEYTNISSQVLLFDNNFNFLSKYNFIDNLNSAHDFNINKNYKSILDSKNSIFYFNKKMIKLKNYFLRGFCEDKELFYIGMSKFKQQKNTDLTAGIAKIIKNSNIIKKIENINLKDITSLLKINKIV